MVSGKLLVRAAIQTTIWLAFMAVLLFVSAGNWRWPQGWAFIGIFAAGSAAICGWLLRRDPALLAARLGPLMQRGQAVWDKIFLAVFVCLWCGWLVFMALDAQRWQTSLLPVWLEVIGGILIVTGFAAVVPVFAANTFAAPVVRIQSERNQRVIDTGPYALVRHPMYAAALLYLVGMPLLLGSWYGLIGTVIFAMGISARAVQEERKLQRELPGYADYITRVRYRLIPGIW